MKPPIARNAKGKPLCEVCRRRLLVDGCPVHLTLMCNPCHAAQRLAYVCPCFTLDQAKKLADPLMARRVAKNLAKEASADQAFRAEVIEAFRAVVDELPVTRRPPRRRRR